MTRRSPIYIRDSGRPASVRSTESVYRGLPTQTGPIPSQIVAQENPDMNAPGNLVLSTGIAGASNVGGFAHAWIQATWNSPIPTGTDNDYLREYEIQFSRAGSTVTVIRTDELSVRLEPVSSGELYTVSVYNVLLSGARGTNFATDTIVAANDSTPPANPGNLIAGAGFRTITARWDDNTEPDMNFGAGSYRIQVADDGPGFGSLVTDKTITGTVTSISDLLPETNYWVRVAAVDTSGNQSAGWSNVEAVTTTKIERIDLQSVPPAVDRIHIAAAAIGEAEIENASITDAKIINLKAGKLTTDTLWSETITIGAQQKALGGFLLSGTSGDITNITVNGVTIIGGTISWAGNLSSMALSAAFAINGFTSSPNYVGIYDVGDPNYCGIEASNYGQGPNGRVVVVTTTGGLIATEDDMANGQLDGIIESSTFSSSGGTQGFQMTGSGNLNAQSGIFRGDIVGGTINIGTNALQVNSNGDFRAGVNAFGVDRDGQVWAGSTTQTYPNAYTNAKFKLSSAGNITMAGNITLSGGKVSSNTTAWKAEFTDTGFTGVNGTYKGLSIHSSDGSQTAPSIVGSTTGGDVILRCAEIANRFTAGSFIILDTGNNTTEGSSVFIGAGESIILGYGSGAATVASQADFTVFGRQQILDGSGNNGGPGTLLVNRNATLASSFTGPTGHVVIHAGHTSLNGEQPWSRATLILEDDATVANEPMAGISLHNDQANFAPVMHSAYVIQEGFQFRRSDVSLGYVPLFASAFTVSSEARFKSEISDIIEDPRSKVRALPVRRFRRDSDANPVSSHDVLADNMIADAELLRAEGKTKEADDMLAEAEQYRAHHKLRNLVESTDLQWKALDKLINGDEFLEAGPLAHEIAEVGLTDLVTLGLNEDRTDLVPAAYNLGSAVFTLWRAFQLEAEDNDALRARVDALEERVNNGN